MVAAVVVAVLGLARMLQMAVLMPLHLLLLVKVRHMLLDRIQFRLHGKVC